MTQPISVTVWNEFIHERKDKTVAAVYPDGIHATLKSAIEEHLGEDAAVRTATFDEREHGLSDAVLAETDVLLWWSHRAHEKVKDTVVDRVHQRVLEGMGLIVLHSSHFSKIFVKLMGTSGRLNWREASEMERLWCVNPGHPIADGVCDKGYIELPHTEMYGEFFDVPTPDELVFISWFAGGEVFRSGCTWTRGKGKVFYFRPGHETYPIYHDPQIRRVIANAVRWASPSSSVPYNIRATNV